MPPLNLMGEIPIPSILTSPKLPPKSNHGCVNHHRYVVVPQKEIAQFYGSLIHFYTGFDRSCNSADVNVYLCSLENGKITFHSINRLELVVWMWSKGNLGESRHLERMNFWLNFLLLFFIYLASWVNDCRDKSATHLIFLCFYLMEIKCHG